MGRHTPRDDERVRSSLREHAESYQPDRAAISTRVAQGRAAEQENKSLLRSMIGIRPIGAALAVVGVLVGGVTAVQASSADDDRNTAEPPPPVAVPTTVSTGPAGSSAPTSSSPRAPSAPQTTTGSGNNPSSGPPSSAAQPSTGPPSPTTAASWLTVGAGLGKDSVATWSENQVTVKTTSPVVALKVTITVPRDGGAKYENKYTTVANGDVSFDIAETDRALTYSFTLRDGLTIAPGEYTFAAQFTHRSGRPAANDGYTIEAGTKSASTERSGSFG